MKLARAFHPLSLSHPPSVSASPFLSLSLFLCIRLCRYTPLTHTYMFLHVYVLPPLYISLSLGRCLSFSIYLSFRVSDVSTIVELIHCRSSTSPFCSWSLLISLFLPASRHQLSNFRYTLTAVEVTPRFYVTAKIPFIVRPGAPRSCSGWHLVRQ